MIRFGPLADIAAADALTAREWEGLGRLAVIIEDPSIVPKHTEHARIAYQKAAMRHMHGNPRVMVGCKIDFIRRQIEYWVNAVIKEVGLNSADFVAIVVPHYPPQTPTRLHDDDIPQTWTIELRLTCERSTAKTKTGASEASHAPTLAEQHGKARKDLT